MSEPKFHVPEAAAIRAEMEKVNPGSARYAELEKRLEDLYKQKAGQ